MHSNGRPNLDLFPFCDSISAFFQLISQLFFQKNRSSNSSSDFSKRTTAVTVPLTELLPAARTELAADIYKEWQIVLNYERK